MNVPHRYGLLRVIAFVLKLLAWLVLAAGIASAFLGVGATQGVTVPQAFRLLGTVVGPVLGIVWFVQLYAFGSILSLLIDIEENTRAMAANPAGSEIAVAGPGAVPVQRP